METILIVEDDPTLLRGLKDNFAYSGYTVLTATDGQQGLETALNRQPDLIVLDLMLPAINGYEVCRLLRKEGLAVPILMLTAKSEESDVVLGLNLGADDYMTKPFGIRELLARVEALLRRRRAARTTVADFGPYRLDLEAHCLTHHGEPVALSPKEFRLLAYFVQRPGRALGRDEILNAVWGYDCYVSPRCIDRFVTTLRNKIEEDPRRPRFIHTVREVGYKFEPDPA